jgi:hypothetical protein
MARQVSPERADHPGQERLAACAEVICLGMLAKQEREPDLRHGGAQAPLPARRTLGARGQIATGAASGIAQAHRQDGDDIRV